MTNRREMLQLAGLCASATATAVWQKPVTETVMLPVHAQASVACAHSGSMTRQTNIDEGDGDGNNPDIAIVFDGETCGLVAFDEDDDPIPADAVIAMDADVDDGEVWDSYGPGANWSITDYGAIASAAERQDGDEYKDIPNGNYEISVSGEPGDFLVNFDVSVIPDADEENADLTVGNVIITRG